MWAFIYLCFMLYLFPCDLYSDGDILLVLLRQRLIPAVSPIFSLTHLLPDVCGCHVLRILAVAVCRIGDVCCLPAPAHQPFSFNSLGLSVPEEACSRNVRASGTLKFLDMKVFLRSHPFRPAFFCCFAPGRFARFHVRPESFRITIATSPHATSPNNRFYKMFLNVITFVIDVDISLYSSLHSVENV